MVEILNSKFGFANSAVGLGATAFVLGVGAKMMFGQEPMQAVKESAHMVEGGAKTIAGAAVDGAKTVGGLVVDAAKGTYHATEKILAYGGTPKGDPHHGLGGSSGSGREIT